MPWSGDCQSHDTLAKIGAEIVKAHHLFFSFFTIDKAHYTAIQGLTSPNAPTKK